MEALAFGNPALLWGALAVAVPFAIHLLSRRRSRRVAFAAIDFILRSKKQKVRHVRLRQLLLLLLRALVIACIALALARPLWRPPQAAAQATGTLSAVAVVVDASMSMRYRLGGEALFDRARKEAKRLLEQLPSDSPVTLVVCDGREVDAEPPGFDRVALRQRLDRAAPSFRHADVTACMSAAARALGESPIEGKKLYVVGDLTGVSLPLDAPAPRVPTPAGDVLPEVAFIDAAEGEPIPNLAVVDVETAPSAALGTRGVEVTATIRNSGDQPAQNVAVALEVNGQVVTRGYVDVPPRGSARKQLAHRFEPGTQRGRVVLAGDALSEDDARAFVVRVPRDVRALVVDGAPSAVRYRDEAFFVEAALGPERTGGRISAVFLDADAAQARPLTGFDVVLLLNVPTPKSGFVEALRTFVESGGGLFVSLGDQAEPDDYNASFGALLPRPLHLVRTASEPGDPAGVPARFARVDLRHPALRVFDGAVEGFDTARIDRYVLLQPDARKDERVLASYDDGAPALIEARRGRGRVVLYTSTVDRDWTDWPIRTSFLPAIQQLTAYLAGGLEEAPAPPARIGDVRPRPELPEGTTVASVTGPDGERVLLVEDGVPVDQPGHYRWTVRDANGERDVPEHSFAALLDPRESDTRRHPADELARHFAGEDAATVAAGADGALPSSGTPLWSWLLMGAVFAFVAEGFLVRRA